MHWRKQNATWIAQQNSHRTPSPALSDVFLYSSTHTHKHTKEVKQKQIKLVNNRKRFILSNYTSVYQHHQNHQIIITSASKYTTMENTKTVKQFWKRRLLLLQLLILLKFSWNEFVSPLLSTHSKQTEFLKSQLDMHPI